MPIPKDAHIRKPAPGDIVREGFMNRAITRRLKHVKHTLIKDPFLKLGFNIALGDGQEKYTCSCRSGWLSISKDRPTAAHAQHVKTIKEAK